MRESLRDLMYFFLENKSTIYYATLAVIVLVLGLSVWGAYKTRDKALSRFEDDEEPLTRLEYLVFVYCPKLIGGCVISLFVMAVVAAPYIIIETFI